MPTDTTEPMMPSARPRSRAGKAAVTMAAPKAVIMAAPTPCAARKPISQPTPGDEPLSPEPTVKMITPLKYSALRPTISAQRPTPRIRQVMVNT